MPDPLAQDDVLSFNPGNPFLSAPDAGPPAPPSPVAGDLRPQIADERGQARIEFEAAKRSMAQEERNASERERELAPLRDRQMKMLTSSIDRSEAAQKALEAKIQKPPEPPQRQNQHDDETWLFASGLLGALAGAFTRNHQTNALAAFTGALTGYQEGSRQKFEQNMEIWKAENTKALETNRQALDEYRAILENNKLNTDQMSIALQVAGAKYEDRGMVTAAKTKNSLVIAQYHDKNAQAMEQMQISSDRLTYQYEQMKARDQAARLQQLKDQASAYVASSEGQARIAAIKRGDMPPPSQGQRGTSFVALRDQAIADQLAAEGYDFGQFKIDQAVKQQGALIPGRVQAAGQAAGERTGQIRAANLEAASRSAGPLVTMAAEAAQHVPATAFPRLNSILQATAEELGDPAMKRFQFANMELGRLIARVINPSSSTITNYQAQSAAELFLTASSPEAYQAALEQAKSLIEREYKASQEQKAHAPLSPIDIPDTTHRTLTPTPRQILPSGAGTIPGTNVAPPPGLRQAFPSLLPDSMSPAKPAAPDMPVMLPEGWSVKELQ